jgi:outer membrane protein
MRNFLRVIPCVLTLLCVAASAVGAATAAKASGDDGPTRVAFVDMERVFKESKRIRKLTDERDRELRNLQNNIEGLTTQYRKLKSDYTRQKSVLGEDKLKAREQELLDLGKQISDLQAEANKQIAKLETDIIDPFLNSILKATKKVAEREKFDLVVRSDLVLFGAPRCDLTAQVVAEFEAEEERKATAAKAADTKTGPAKNTGDAAKTGELERTGRTKPNDDKGLRAP